MPDPGSAEEGEGPRREIDDFIRRELPASFSSDEILGMFRGLERDVALLRKAPGMNDSRLGLICQQKHKRLAFSYPGLFFRTLRGEIDPSMLERTLDLKRAMDEDRITLAEARNRVIDGAKEDIESRPIGSRGRRKKKARPEGTVVQELSLRCRPEDG